MTTNNIDYPNETLVNYPDKSEATSLAFALAEAADERRRAPFRDDDGVVRSGHLERDGNRLYMRGEPETWFDISGDGAPITEYDTDSDLPHKVRHQDAPMTEFHGWHETADGWVLISSDGASWQPEAYVPEESR